MTEATPEKKLLRAVVRQHVIGGTSSGDMGALLQAVNWTRLLWLGRQHGVLSHVQEAVNRPECAALCPPGIRRQLHELRAVHQLRALTRIREICRLQDLFDRDRIPAVAVIRWCAGSPHGSRPDTIEPGTILPYIVTEADRERAAALLLAAGHPTRHNLKTLVTLGRSPVLLDGYFGHTDRDRVLARTGTVLLGGRPIRSPDPVHQLLSRVWKTEIPEELPLQFGAELACIARGLTPAQWQDVFPEAVHFGLAFRLAEALTLAHRELDLPLPAGSTVFFDAVATAGPATPAPPARARPPVSEVPFLPTPPTIMTRMLELADVGPADVVYDLGCGDGRFVIEAAQRFGARGVGVDFNPDLIARANALARAQGVADRVTFVLGDVFETDLREATVLCLYLLPSFFARLQDRIRHEARPGLRIVSHDYTFPEWPPEKTEIIRSGPMKISQIFLWRLP